jgi:hypothetical protein
VLGVAAKTAAGIMLRIMPMTSRMLKNLFILLAMCYLLFM